MSDGRARNGRAIQDFSAYHGLRDGSRVLSASGIFDVDGRGLRQMLEVTCDCGNVTRAYPTHLPLLHKGKIPVCRVCRGTGVRRKTEAEYVGEVIGSLHVLSRFTRLRPDGEGVVGRFRVKCVAAGHVFERVASDVISGRYVGCPDCDGTRSMVRAMVGANKKKREAAKAPEVCNCAWHNGVQRYVCARHKGAA